MAVDHLVGHVTFQIAHAGNGDRDLLRLVLSNLLSNAWKFTSKVEQACIEVGSQEQNGQCVFFVRDNGRRAVTPLFLVLLVVESTDVIFAVDSIPAIFAVTSDPFIVFTSNIFAILGLRSLYFAIASLIGRFEYLKAGLSMVLVFIGAKMLAARWVHVNAALSLAVVVALLGGAIGISLLKTRRLAAATGRVAPPPERSGTGARPLD